MLLFIFFVSLDYKFYDGYFSGHYHEIIAALQCESTCDFSTGRYVTDIHVYQVIDQLCDRK